MELLPHGGRAFPFSAVDGEFLSVESAFSLKKLRDPDFPPFIATTFQPMVSGSVFFGGGFRTPFPLEKFSLITEHSGRLHRIFPPSGRVLLLVLYLSGKGRRKGCTFPIGQSSLLCAMFFLSRDIICLKLLGLPPENRFLFTELLPFPANSLRSRTCLFCVQGCGWVLFGGVSDFPFVGLAPLFFQTFFFFFCDPNDLLWLLFFTLRRWTRVDRSPILLKTGAGSFCSLVTTAAIINYLALFDSPFFCARTRFPGSKSFFGLR